MMFLQTYQSVLVASNKKSSSTVWLFCADVCSCPFFVNLAAL